MTPPLLLFPHWRRCMRHVAIVAGVMCVSESVKACNRYRDASRSGQGTLPHTDTLRHTHKHTQRHTFTLWGGVPGMMMLMWMWMWMWMRMRHASVIHWTNKARHVASTMKRIKVDYNMKLDLSMKLGLGRWQLQVECWEWEFSFSVALMGIYTSSSSNDNNNLGNNNNLGISFSSEKPRNEKAKAKGEKRLKKAAEKFV